MNMCSDPSDPVRLYEAGEATRLHLAHTARNRAPRGEGLLEVKGHEDNPLLVGFEEPPSCQSRSTPAVVVVGVQDDQRPLAGRCCAEHGMTGSPRLGTLRAKSVLVDDTDAGR